MFRFENRPKYRSKLEDMRQLGEDVLSHPDYARLKAFSNHGRITVYKHSMSVTLKSLVVSDMLRRLGLELDRKALVRGALLHDFYLYDWTLGQGPPLHGIRHPPIALKRSMERFALGKKETDIIRHHMWPLTISPPRSAEAWIVSLMDKLSAVDEYLFLEDYDCEGSVKDASAQASDAPR